VVAVRVFARDIRTIGTRLLGVGVRVGAAQLAAQYRRGEAVVRTEDTQEQSVEHN
jgi:hypothetical protein